MGRFTRPAARLLGCSPSVVDVLLVALLVLFNVLVFLVYFQVCAPFSFCRSLTLTLTLTLTPRLHTGVAGHRVDDRLPR